MASGQDLVSSNLSIICSVRVEPSIYPDVSLIPSLLAQLSYTGEHG